LNSLLHDIIFDFFETYRISHPNFLYWLRERNTNGKLDAGMWFQGNESYAFVGLYDANGGPKRTRSIGLLFTMNAGKVQCSFEVAYPELEEQKKIRFYEQVVKMVGGSLDSSKKRYEKILSSTDGFAEATTFLDTIKPKIDELVQQNNLQEIFITPKKFSHQLKTIEQLRTSLKTTDPVTSLNITHMDTNLQNPLNQILFGPPGTGKTYHTITQSVKIVDPEYFKQNAANRNKLQERFNELLIKDWIEPKGQISFCTFHQSFSYEDFVEGIKPIAPKEGDTYLKYKVEWGIFKNICRLAGADNNAQKLAKENLVSLTQDEFDKAVFYKISLGDSTKDEDKEIYDYCVSNNVISIGFGVSTNFTGKDETQVNDIVTKEKLDPYAAQAINYFKNYLKVGNYVVVSYGNSYIRALGKVTGDYEYKPDAEIRYKHFRKVDWVFKNVEIPVAEFYQKNLLQQTIYKLKSEYIIPEFFVRRSKPVVSDIQQKKFVLIIDEINRGNVSSIFGELITLIEPSKRSGKPEALEVVLPYSKERFTVPSNVYIIGTMNTADRSIESLDTALRRRFSFKEMIPIPNLITTEGKSKGVVDGIDLVKMLQKMNGRIEKLIDKDHQIGHSYFLDVLSKEGLELSFKDKVIPLLEEYFFGDFGKIGLVLGSSFIRKEEVEDFGFADFGDYDPQAEQDLKQRSVYKIQPIVNWDYKSIYEPKTKA